MSPSAVSPLPAIVDSVKPRGILRKRAVESHDLEPQLSPTKRQRVTFQPEPESLVSPGIEAKDAAILREEVTYSLNHRDGAGKEKYEDIRRYFDERLDGKDAPSSRTMRGYIVALTSNVPLLKPSFSDLVNAVLHHHWLGRDDAFVISFTRFLGHLVSAQGGYLSNVLKMLVESLAHLSTSTGSYSALTLPARSKLQLRLHTALGYILKLIPSASGMLSSIISQSFPFIADSKKAHIDYVRNILRVTEYAPELKSVILDLIIERTLKIDVQVQMDVEELQEEVEELLVQGLSRNNSSQMNKLDGDGMAESDSESSEDDELDAEELRLKTLKSSVNKMDAILDLLFSYHDPVISQCQGPNHLEAESTFNQLLAQFRKNVLPTYQSRHTQFLLFHFAQTSPEFISLFAETCTQILTDKSRFSAFRVSAAAYVAAFIARGAHVEPEMVIYIFNTLARYSDRLRATQEAGCRSPDMRKYGPYYATVQALLYIFCFRWRDLIAPSLHPSDSGSDDDDEDSVDTALLDGRRPPVFLPLVKDAFFHNVYCRLNPLKICAPEITEEFAKIAHHLNFMYVYPKLEANKRLNLAQYANPVSGGRETSLATLRGERAYQLDAYFPFDPYNLPMSKRWLVGDYREWRGVPGLRDDAFPESDIRTNVKMEDSDEEMEADEDDEDDEDEEPTGAGSDQERPKEEPRTATPSDDDVEGEEDVDDDESDA